MTTYPTENDIGKTTVSPEVLDKIARLTALSVEGVSRMANIQSCLQKFSGDDNGGVKIDIRDDHVFVDVYVVMISDINVRDVAREIQSRVSRAISEMVGMDVGGVNIHIMDIDFNV